MNIKLLIVCLLISFKATFALDITEEIAAAIKSGNSKAIAAYFTDNVDLKVLAQEDVYSKAQAELIVKDFFTRSLRSVLWKPQTVNTEFIFF
jgi:hypothetical protein